MFIYLPLQFSDDSVHMKINKTNVHVSSENENLLDRRKLSILNIFKAGQHH